MYLTKDMLEEACNAMKRPYPYLEAHDPRGISIKDLEVETKKIGQKLLKSLRKVQAKKTHYIISIPFTNKYIRLWQKKS